VNPAATPLVTDPTGQIPSSGPLDLADIQGFILRGYTMPALRCFVLRIDDWDGARRFLGSLVTGDAAAAGPQITTAVPWAVKPEYCLNAALTYEGLKALGLSAESLRSFPEEFVRGAVAGADRVGDTGGSAPGHWKGGLGAPETVHMLLMLWAQRSDVLEDRTAALRSMFAQGGALAEVFHHDAHALPDNLTHFGYRDGFSQPNIVGGPWAGLDDPLPRAPAGEFLLGHPSQFRDFSYPVPAPHALGVNGSFIAFRILQQDVDGFERFLRDTAPALGMSAEKLAAKICGRWRNGVPLVLSPETDAPDTPIPPERMNYFDYVPTGSCPDAHDDRRGYRCPVGSHIRRVNPRSQRVAGNGGHLHRIVRRGLPYGPPYDPAHPGDGIERGLMGIFIGVSLRDQFEFLMREWVNDGTFAPGLGRTKDPLCGDNRPEESRFVIPGEDGSHTIRGFSRFVTTRGGAYCFLPSLTALRYLASLPSVD
jgi:Dyp-type peroxidase family